MSLNKYWRDYPPTHMMVGAYFGLGKKKRETDEEKKQNFDALINLFNETKGMKVTDGR